MSIQHRLNRLEQQTGRGDGQHGTPVKPMEWSDEQYNAVLTGLGIRNRPFSILAFTDEFMEQYRQPINQIFKELERGITPDKLVMQAEPMEQQR
jgi:hypothetical protein